MTVAAVVPRELFRPKLRRLWRRSAFAPLRLRASGLPAASLFIFKALLVQTLYNLCDEHAEYQLCGRLSFMRFLGLRSEDSVLYATTLWLYFEVLARAGAVDELFAGSETDLREHGLLATGGQIVDAKIIVVPCQRNSMTKNAAIKTSERPGGRQQKTSRALEAMRLRGDVIPDALLAHLAPLGWQHINLTGDFLWGADVAIEPDGFRPLRGTGPRLPTAIAA